MAYTSITLENPHTGAIKEAPVGFSWTVFFFNFFPPLFRGDFKWAVIFFLLAMLTMGLSAIVFMFIYNKLYIKDLIGAGYKIKSFKDEASKQEVAAKLNMPLPLLDNN